MNAYFLSLFAQEHQLNQLLMEQDHAFLLSKKEVSYLSRGTHVHLLDASMGFVAEGLVKEYRRASRCGPTFMQVIEKNDFFIFNSIGYRHSCKALGPSWILHVPIALLVTTFKCNPRISAWIEHVWIIHEARHTLPFYLRDIKETQLDFAISQTEFVRYLASLSNHEVSQYMSIS